MPARDAASTTYDEVEKTERLALNARDAAKADADATERARVAKAAADAADSAASAAARAAAAAKDIAAQARGAAILAVVMAEGAEALAEEAEALATTAAEIATIKDVARATRLYIGDALFHEVTSPLFTLLRAKKETATSSGTKLNFYGSADEVKTLKDRRIMLEKAGEESGILTGTAEEIIRAVREENEIIELLGEMKIRLTRFQGNRVIEVCPSSFEQIRELRETALINIIQNSRNRFFLPEDEKQAIESLEKVLKSYPPASLLKSEEKAFTAQKTTNLDLKREPVSLPNWLIEPPKEEVNRILVRV